MNACAFSGACLAKGACSVAFTGACTAATDAGAGLCLCSRKSGLGVRFSFTLWGSGY